MDAAALRAFTTPATVLHVLRCAAQLHAALPCPARAAAVELLQRRLAECAACSGGAEALRAALGDERQWAVLQADAATEARARCVAKTAGTVLEKEAPCGGFDSLARAGADGGVTYPLGCLLSTAAWPPGVDPGARELSLHDEEFAALFGCDKPAFGKQPAWKKLAERKKHDLF